jgi:hypothetical protein
MRTIRLGGLILLSLWASYGATTFLQAQSPRPPLVYWHTGDGGCWPPGTILEAGVMPGCRPLPEFVDT